MCVCVLETVGAWEKLRRVKTKKCPLDLEIWKLYGENFSGVLGVKPRLVGDE